MKIKDTSKTKKKKIWVIERIVIDVPDSFSNKKKAEALSKAKANRDKKRGKGNG